MKEAHLRSIEVPKVFKDACLGCHSVKTLDLRGGGTAPDLSHILFKAKRHGGLENYIKEKYKTDPYEFFLYPSKFVPQMAVIEGRVSSKDVDELLLFFDVVPVQQSKEPPLLPLILLLALLVVILFKLRKKKGFMVR